MCRSQTHPRALVSDLESWSHLKPAGHESALPMPTASGGCPQSNECTRNVAWGFWPASSWLLACSYPRKHNLQFLKQTYLFDKRCLNRQSLVISSNSFTSYTRKLKSRVRGKSSYCPPLCLRSSWGSTFSELMIVTINP